MAIIAAVNARPNPIVVEVDNNKFSVKLPKTKKIIIRISAHDKKNKKVC